MTENIEHDVAAFFVVVDERGVPPSSFISQIRQLVESSKRSAAAMKAIRKELSVVMRETFTPTEKLRFQSLSAQRATARDDNAANALLKKTRLTTKDEFRTLLAFVDTACSSGNGDDERVSHANQLLANFENETRVKASKHKAK